MIIEPKMELEEGDCVELNGNMWRVDGFSHGIIDMVGEAGSIRGYSSSELENLMEKAGSFKIIKAEYAPQDF